MVSFATGDQEMIFLGRIVSVEDLPNTRSKSWVASKEGEVQSGKCWSQTILISMD